MYFDRLELHVSRGWAKDAFDFHLGHRKGQEFLLATSITWEPVPPHGLAPSSSFRLLPDQSQQLMDELWSVGLRPTQGRMAEGAFEAQGRHLSDMRQLVFDRLKVPKPE